MNREHYREFYICDVKLFCMEDGKSVEVTERDTELIADILDRVQIYYPRLSMRSTSATLRAV